MFSTRPSRSSARAAAEALFAAKRLSAEAEPVIRAIVKSWKSNSPGSRSFGFCSLPDHAGNAVIFAEVLPDGFDSLPRGATISVRIAPGRGPSPEVTEILSVDLTTATPDPLPLGKPERRRGVLTRVSRNGYAFIRLDIDDIDAFVGWQLAERAGLAQLKYGTPLDVDVARQGDGRFVVVRIRELG
jgi:cold shock CspA family protein